jgi:predicted metal-dependent hydrolase
VRQSARTDRLQKRRYWFERYQPRTPARQYINGESHLYLGRQYRLKLNSGKTTSIKLTRGELLVTLPGAPEPERVRTVLHRWYLDRARGVFREVLEASLLRFKGVEQPRLTVRAMQSRWGSLSRAGTMTLNVNLVRAPLPCIEYVVTHELCHAKHRDHDARFFKLLGQVMPDWKQRKKRLEAALL